LDGFFGLLLLFCHGSDHFQAPKNQAKSHPSLSH
jgi:hypothetical protein